MCIFPCWRGCLYRDGHGYLMRLKCFSYHCQWFFDLKWRKQTNIPFDEVTEWCYGKALCCQVVIRFSNSCGFLALEAVAPGSLREMIHSISGGKEDAGCFSLLTPQVSADKSIQNCSADNPPWASLNCGVKITNRKGRWAQSRPNTGSLALTTYFRNCQHDCNTGFLKAAEGTPAIALWSGLIFVTSILHITRKSSVGKCSFANKEHSHSYSFKGGIKWIEGRGESQGSAASLANLELPFPLQNINYIWLCC